MLKIFISWVKQMFEGLRELIQDSKDSLHFARNAISILADDNSTDTQKKHAKISISQSIDELFLSFICLLVLVPLICLSIILVVIIIVGFSFSIHFILGVFSLIMILIIIMCVLGFSLHNKYSELFYKILNKIVNPRKKKNYEE